MFEIVGYAMTAATIGLIIVWRRRNVTADAPPVTERSPVSALTPWQSCLALTVIAGTALVVLSCGPVSEHGILADGLRIQFCLDRVAAVKFVTRIASELMVTVGVGALASPVQSQRG